MKLKALTLQMPDSIFDEIERTGLSTKEFLKKAIGDELYIRNELAKGSKFFTQPKGLGIQELNMG